MHTSFCDVGAILMSDCRRHILASHLCPTRVLGGDRLELVMDRASSPQRPFIVSSSGIVWGQFAELAKARAAFYDILLGRKDPLEATRVAKDAPTTLTTATKLRLVLRDPSQASVNDLVPAPALVARPEKSLQA